MRFANKPEENAHAFNRTTFCIELKTFAIRFIER